MVKGRPPRRENLRFGRARGGCGQTGPGRRRYGKEEGRGQGESSRRTRPKLPDR